MTREGAAAYLLHHDKEDDVKRALVLVGIAAAGTAAVALAGVGLPETARGDTSTARTITVNGTGSVEARPDRAQFSFGVESRGATAREASAENAVAARRLVEALRDAGVAARDTQTEHVSVWPTTERPGAEPAAYTASSSVRVEVPIAAASGVVAAATGAGATNIWGPSLTRSASDALEEQALERALDDARRKARALADATGSRLVEVVKIVEGGAAGEPVVYEGAARAAKADAGVPIEPGRVETSASLTVTFSLS